MFPLSLILQVLCKYGSMYSNITPGYEVINAQHLFFFPLPSLPAQPQDQILWLAAPFRDLELLAGTSQWMGHGHQ